ncbi:hypothetical protein BJ875DRAFT_419536 [Amylocarpus encephaloides]|uniref:NAD(P)-binding protein n=1 Tax=Amylocarpus encephaloides TaxID=45428 RepID=A0A9P7YNK3_9HELO|nr:hypothetical protein BJ875DRAFT_419536 [Amylocarpus encephaloides]
MSANFDADAYSRPACITKTMHREPNPTLSPSPADPSNTQSGMIILITGGGTGIGAGITKTFALAKETGVIVAGRRLEPLEQIATSLKRINSDINVLTLQVDVNDNKAVESLFDKAKAHYGRLPDVVVSNAGYIEKPILVCKQETNDWWKGFEVNLKGTYSLLHHFIKGQGDDPVGTFVSVGSAVAGMNPPTRSAYAISKLAQQRLMECTHLEYPTLRVFTIHPGIVATPFTDDGELAPFAKDHPELAGQLIGYLAQSRADYARGGYISVNWDVLEIEANKKRIVNENML